VKLVQKILTVLNVCLLRDVYACVIGCSAGRSTVARGRNATSSECSNLRFQSSVIDVYARFVLIDEHAATSYLLHRKAQFLVTDIVHSLLQVADETIARLRNEKVVDGVKPGRTSVQVTSLCNVFCAVVNVFSHLPCEFAYIYFHILHLVSW